MSAPQNFKNHGRFVPMYHYFLAGLVFTLLVMSVINLFQDGVNERSLMDTGFSVALLVAGFYARVFALKAQDRAIRAEENFRHHLLTGKPLDSGLNMRQIIGLRFASDAEFPDLCARAAAEGMEEKAIKQAVQSWRADHDRA